MSTLEPHIRECCHILDQLNIPYGKVRKWEINIRAKSRWGLCKQVGKGIFEISISARLLENPAAEQALKDTIVHELLHTVPGCFDHGTKWKRYAELVNRTYPQYTIKRTASPEEKGLQMEPPKRTTRYVLQCTKCGTQFPRERLSEAVKHPENYRCGSCSGKLIRVK